MKYNILNPKPMNGTPGNYQLPVEQTQDFWLNIWENKMSKLLEFHQMPQNKRQNLLETIRTYLKPYQQSPSCIPLEETTKFLRNANQENQVITAESLLFFYEKVKASPAHSCQIKDFINEKAALNKWLEKAKLELNASRYSRRTKTNYLTAIHKLLNYTQKPVEEISSDDIKEFLVQLHQKKNLAAITVNNFNSGIRFFLTKVLASDIPMAEIPMMRKNKSLPEVFSQKEIERILAIINNLKHKSLLMCAYGGGLRLSEVVALKRKHIDFEREQIWVRSGKGRKDRCVMLNGALKQVLHIYAENFDLESYLFPSQQRKGQPITTRTAQAVLEQACEKANITGKRNMHKLRHSFATHLLENGVELPHIQALLGHSKIQTTMIYTHVSNATVRKIQSPLNFLNLGNNQTA